MSWYKDLVAYRFYRYMYHGEAAEWEETRYHIKRGFWIIITFGRKVLPHWNELHPHWEETRNSHYQNSARSK